MPMRFVETVWSDQPQELTEIDMAGPYFASLNSFFNAADGRYLWTRGAGRQQFPDLAPNSSPVVGVGGQGMGFNGSSNFEVLPAGSLSENINTRFALLRWDSALRSTISTGINGGARSLLWEITADGKLGIVEADWADVLQSSSGTVSPNEYCVVAMSYDGSTARLYKNGVLVASGGYGGPFATGRTPVLGKHYGDKYYFAGDIYAHVDFFEALGPSAVADISANVWALLAPQRIPVWTPSASAAANLAATAIANASASAALTHGVPLAAAATAVDTATAALIAQINLAASAASSATAGATMAHAVPLAAAAASVDAATAALSKAVALSAAAQSASAASAGLAHGVPLAADAQASAAALAGLVVTQAGLAANAQAQASATAALALGVRFDAAAASSATATAALLKAVNLAASGAGQASGTAALSVATFTGLAANAIAQATAVAALALQIRLAGAALSTATATAFLGGNVGVITPSAYRWLVVPAQVRTLAVAAEPRVLSVAAEQRYLSISR